MEVDQVESGTFYEGDRIAGQMTAVPHSPLERFQSSLPGGHSRIR